MESNVVIQSIFYDYNLYARYSFFACVAGRHGKYSVSCDEYKQFFILLLLYFIRFNWIFPFLWLLLTTPGRVVTVLVTSYFVFVVKVLLHNPTDPILILSVKRSKFECALGTKIPIQKRDSHTSAHLTLQSGDIMVQRIYWVFVFVKRQ